MKLRSEWQGAVAPKHFYLAVFLVSLCLGGMGIYSMATGTLPKLGPFFWAASLLIVGIATLVNFVRCGRYAFPLPRLIFLLGFLLFASSHLVNFYVAVPSWIENLGTFLIGFGLLSQMFVFGKGREIAP